VWLLSIAADKPMVPRLLTTRKNYVSSIAFSRDSQSLAFGSEVGNVELWNIADTVPWALRSWPAHPRAEVTSITFSPDGLFLASGGLNGTVQLVRLGDKKNFRSMPTTLVWHQLIWSIAFANDRWPGLADDEVGFAIGDEADTVSFWALSSKQGKMRFFDMPSHFAMTLQADGAKIAGSKMSKLSSRLLNQYIVQGEANIVDEAPYNINSKPETKSAGDSKIETKATVTSTLAAAPRSTSFTSSGGPGLFAGGVPKTTPTIKPDAKAQILLIELYTLIDEVYPANRMDTMQERKNYLARLEPYQDRQATLTAADRVQLRELQVELEKAQQAQAVAVLDL
jgi:WD40 repeat protein